MYDKDDRNEKRDFLKSPILFAVGAFAIGLLLGRSMDPSTESESLVEEKDSTIVADTFAVDTVVNEKNTKIRKAFVVSETGYVLKGGRYKADVYLVDIDTSLKQTIIVNNKPLEHNEYSFVCASTGTRSYEGHIEVVEPDSTISEYPFSGSYTVIEPLANITSEVLYAGKENPVVVTAPGFSAEKISLETTNLVVRKVDESHYILIPIKTKRICFVTVTATLEDGRKVYLSKKQFRIVE